MKTFLRSTVWIVAVFSSLLVAGALAYQVPYIGLTTFLLTPLAGVFAVLGAALSVVAVVGWRRKASMSRGILLALSLFTFLGSGYIAYRVAATLIREGVEIDWLAILLPIRRDAVSPDVDVVYSTFEGQPLSLSIYRPPQTSASSPVLLYVHGGGWYLGARNDVSPELKWFSQQGFVVVTASYPLSTADRHLWDKAHEQLACAVQWIGDNIAQYGGDVNRIGIIGESAGGNLALNLSYMAASGTLPSCGGTAPRFRAALVTCPVVDLVSFYQNDDAALGEWSKEMVGYYTGGSPEEVPNRFAATSSFSYITSQAPPTLILVGEADHLVPPDGAYRFAAQAKAAGVDVRLASVPYSDHGFNAVPGSMGHQAFRQMTMEWFAVHGLAP